MCYMKLQKLKKDQILSKMEGVNGWELIKDGIEKNFLFKDFNEAFSFLTRIAMLSEKMDHHADWSGIYNKVHIRLSTHDSKGITQKDIDMAAAIERFIQK